MFAWLTLRLHACTMDYVEWVYQEFGKRLRAARTDLHLSQEYVARYVGLSRTSITNIERGRQRIPLHVAYELAGAVRSRPTDLMPQHPDDQPRPKELTEFEAPVREWMESVVRRGRGTTGRASKSVRK